MVLRRRTNMRRMLAAVPLAVLVLAACGSSDDDDTSGTGGGTVPTVTDTTPPTGSGPTTSPSTPPSSGPPSSRPPFTSESLSPKPSSPGSIPSGTPMEHDLPLVEAAVEDLAGRLGVDPAEVTVVQALAVTWPDGSLGCPEPGMMYTQVLMDGSFVLLESGGRQYEYHGGDPLFLCEPGKGPVAPES